LQTTEHHKNRKYKKCRTMTPSMPHDDPMSLVLVLSVIPKYRTPSSRPLLRPCSHWKKELTHFEVTPLFGHTGDEISKNREKKNTGLQGGVKLSLAPNLDDFFPNALNQSLLLFVYCSYKCSRASCI
jgi:hypothetical protein